MRVRAPAGQSTAATVENVVQEFCRAYGLEEAFVREVFEAFEAAVPQVREEARLDPSGRARTCLEIPAETAEARKEHYKVGIECQEEELGDSEYLVDLKTCTWDNDGCLKETKVDFADGYVDSIFGHWQSIFDNFDEEWNSSARLLNATVDENSRKPRCDAQRHGQQAVQREKEAESPSVQERTGDGSAAADNKERLIAFGKYRGWLYGEVREKDPGYCKWVVKEAETAPSSCLALKKFACFLQDASEKSHCAASPHEERLGFGMYKGETFGSVREKDPGYCKWVRKEAATAASCGRGFQRFATYLNKVAADTAPSQSRESRAVCSPETELPATTAVGPTLDKGGASARPL